MNRPNQLVGHIVVPAINGKLIGHFVLITGTWKWVCQVWVSVYVCGPLCVCMCGLADTQSCNFSISTINLHFNFVFSVSWMCSAFIKENRAKNAYQANWDIVVKFLLRFFKSAVHTKLQLQASLILLLPNICNICKAGKYTLIYFCLRFHYKHNLTEIKQLLWHILFRSRAFYSQINYTVIQPLNH